MFVVLYSDAEIIVCPYDEKKHAAVGAAQFFAGTELSLSTNLNICDYRQIIGELPLHIEIRTRPRMDSEVRNDMPVSLSA